MRCVLALYLTPPFSHEPDVCFQQAGARPHPTLHPAHIILGIKETPLAELATLTDPLPLTGHAHPVPRTHLMFSHTHKGQFYNMPLLAQFLSSDLKEAQTKPRLIDYELLTDEQGKRTVGFGWFAGGAFRMSCLRVSIPSDTSSVALSSAFSDLLRAYSRRRTRITLRARSCAPRARNCQSLPGASLSPRHYTSHRILTVSLALAARVHLALILTHRSTPFLPPYTHS